RLGTNVSLIMAQNLANENVLLEEQLGILREREGLVSGAQSAADENQAAARMEKLEEKRDQVRSRYGTLAQQREIALEQATNAYKAQLAVNLSDDERRIIEQTRDEELAGIRKVYDEREKRERERGRRGSQGRDG